MGAQAAYRAEYEGAVARTDKEIDEAQALIARALSGPARSNAEVTKQQCQARQKEKCGALYNEAAAVEQACNQHLRHRDSTLLAARDFDAWLGAVQSERLLEEIDRKV